MNFEDEKNVFNRLHEHQPKRGEVDKIKKSGRFKDNNYNPKLHSKTFLTTGGPTHAKYVYSKAAGLSHLFDVQSGVLEKMNVEEQHKCKLDFKEFKEYRDMGEGDMIITIEHCSNCNLHNSNTRHVEEKYLLFAKRLKQLILHRYPMTNVYTKPIINSIDSNSSSINLKRANERDALKIEMYRPQLRVGAFEVQLCVKQNKAVRKEVLHSKLKTKAWPNFSAVLEKISRYAPKCNINLKVMVAYDDQDNREISTHGMRVTLCEKSDEIDELNSELSQELRKIKGRKSAEREREVGENENAKSLASLSAVNTPGRPWSSSTNRSHFSKGGMRSTRQRDSEVAVGQSGRYMTFKEFRQNQRPQSAVVAKKRKPKVEEGIDINGFATFIDLPVNSYEVEVIETKNFMGNKKIINVIAEAGEGGDVAQVIVINAFIEIKPQKYGFPSITLVENETIVQNANIYAILLKPREEEKPERYIYDFDFAYESKAYEGILTPGEYLIIANKQKYNEINQWVDFPKGESSLQLEMEEHTTRRIDVEAYDVIQGTPLTGVFLTLTCQGSNMSIEGLTGEGGKYGYNIHKIGLYSILVQKEEFITYSKDFYISKDTETHKLIIPMMHVSTEERDTPKIAIIHSSDKPSSDFQLYLMCPKDEEVVNSNSPNSQEENGATLYGEHRNKYGTCILLSSGLDDWYRVCVKIVNSEYRDGDDAHLDRNLINRMQRENHMINIIVDNELLTSIYAPSFIDGGIWDIGFINPKQKLSKFPHQKSIEIITINSTIENLSHRLLLFNQYLSFYQYLNSINMTNFKRLFGFERDGIYKIEDFVIDPYVFMKILNSIEFIPVESKEDGEGKDAFIKSFTSSIKDLFGEVSYKRLMKNVSPFITSMSTGGDYRTMQSSYSPQKQPSLCHDPSSIKKVRFPETQKPEDEVEH